MERINLKHKKAQKALLTLKEILNEPYSIIVRDATIQRFEYTFEAFWKCIREYLKQNKKIMLNSPKDCFREIFSLGLTSEEETAKLLEMIDERNKTSHTYNEEVANEIYSKVKEYAVLMDKTLSQINKSS